MTKLGRTYIIRHCIDKENTKPINLADREKSVRCQSKARDIMEDMLMNDVIQPSQSPLGESVMLVQKEDSKLRVLTTDG